MTGRRLGRDVRIRYSTIGAVPSSTSGDLSSGKRSGSRKRKRRAASRYLDHGRRECHVAEPN